MVSRKLPMQTLQKLHLSNRLYIKQVISLVDAFVICKSLFKDRQAELTLLGDALRWELFCFGNQSIGLHCKPFDWFLCDSGFLLGGTPREVRGFCLIPWWGGFCKFCRNFRSYAFFGLDYLPRGGSGVSVFCAVYSTVLPCCP